MADLKHYFYEGPVESFGKCVINDWYGETLAVSPAKAKANLLYQCKKELGLVPSASVTLVGKIKEWPSSYPTLWTL